MIALDAASDLRTVLPQARAQGIEPDAVAVYTGTGGAGDVVATQGYVQEVGLPALAVFPDAYVNGGSPGTPEQGAQDGASAVAEAQALGLPAGRALGFDIEHDANKQLTGGYLVAVARAIIAGGWRPVLYVSAFDPDFSAALDAALAQDYATMDQALWWLASWLTTGDPPAPAPSWANPLGPAGLPWQPAHRDAVAAWQYAGVGAFDLSIVRAPLTGLLWLPKAEAPAVDVPGAIALLKQALGKLGA